MPQRAVVTEDHPPAFTPPRPLGQQRQKAHCPQAVASPLLGVGRQRPAGQRLALPTRADRRERLLRASFRSSADSRCATRNAPNRRRNGPRRFQDPTDRTARTGCSANAQYLSEQRLGLRETRLLLDAQRQLVKHHRIAGRRVTLRAAGARRRRSRRAPVRRRHARSARWRLRRRAEQQHGRGVDQRPSRRRRPLRNRGERRGFACGIEPIGAHQRSERLALAGFVATGVLQQEMAEREAVGGNGIRRGGPRVAWRAGDLPNPPLPRSTRP